MTYTYATLDVSAAVYDEIAGKLKAAAYDQAFHEQADGSVVIDMHGLALVRESAPGSQRCQDTQHAQAPGGLTIGSRTFERLSQKTPGT